VIDSQQIWWMEMASMESKLALGEFPAIRQLGSKSRQI
jgi:hypothetical protein